MQGGEKKRGEREEQRDFHARLGLSSLRLNSLVFRGAAKSIPREMRGAHGESRGD